MTAQRRSSTLFLVRHGVTGWNLAGRYNSSTDIPLDGAAGPALERLGGHLDGTSIDRVLSSPLLRARETAAILSRTGGIRAETEVRHELVELGFGDFEGRTRQELRHGRHAAAFASWLTGENGEPAAPGGESWREASGRADVILREASSKPGRMLVVSHGYLLRILLVVALGLPASATRRFRWANASMTELERHDDRWLLVRHGWTPTATCPPPRGR